MDTHDQPTDAQKLPMQGSPTEQDCETIAGFDYSSGDEDDSTLPATALQKTPETPDVSTALVVSSVPGTLSVPVQRDLARRQFIERSLDGVIVASAFTVVSSLILKRWLRPDSLKQPPVGGQTPVAGQAQIGHLLRRAGFGTSSAEMVMYQKMGYEGAVNYLLDYQKVNDSAMEQRLNALNLDMSKIADQQRWWLLRMAWTQRPLLEKMTLFWSGVLTSSFRKVGGARFYERLMIQNNFLRTHAFDTYDAILLGITADPAMLFYLDLNSSTAMRPNENYARELMELFTLGLGNYTQPDVFEVAAALTGWHIRGLTSYYNAATHNDLTKRILGQTGNFDYKDVVRILAAHPATAISLSRRLFAFFVHENPTNADLKPLVDAYTQSGHNMGAVMRALLLSPQFASSQAYRSRIKSPAEFLVGMYRALGVQDDGTNDGSDLRQFSTAMGQPLFDPPNVAGWPGDKLSANWLNSGSWMTRLNYIDRLLVQGAQGNTGQPLVDLQRLINANKLSSPDQFVDHFASFLLDGPLPTERRTQLLEYFTEADNSSRQRITLTNGQAYPLNRVRGTLYLLLSSPEYQLN